MQDALLGIESDSVREPSRSCGACSQRQPKLKGQQSSGSAPKLEWRSLSCVMRSAAALWRARFLLSPLPSPYAESAPKWSSTMVTHQLLPCWCSFSNTSPCTFCAYRFSVARMPCGTPSREGSYLSSSWAAAATRDRWACRRLARVASALPTPLARMLSMTAFYTCTAACSESTERCPCSCTLQILGTGTLACMHAHDACTYARMRPRTSNVTTLRCLYK